MIAKSDARKLEELDPLEGMKRVYVKGSRADLRVPFREIELQSTRLPDGKLQQEIEHGRVGLLEFRSGELLKLKTRLDGAELRFEHGFDAVDVLALQLGVGGERQGA